MGKPKLAVVLGKSRSGKDTINKILQRELGYKRFHLLQDYYFFLENYFNLPKGSIIDGNGKEMIMPGTSDVTLHEFLVDFYLVAERKNIQWTVPAIEKLTKNLTTDTTITSIRNLHDAKIIIKNKNYYDIILIEVKRNTEIELESDKKLEQIKGMIIPHSSKHLVFDNNSTIENLQKLVLENFDK